jgi:hypothetical protein
MAHAYQINLLRNTRMIASSTTKEGQRRFERVAGILSDASAATVLKSMLRLLENPEEMLKRYEMYEDHRPLAVSEDGTGVSELGEKRELQLVFELIQLPTWIEVDEAIVKELVTTMGKGDVSRELSTDIALTTYLVPKAVQALKETATKLSKKDNYPQELLTVIWDFDQDLNHIENATYLIQESNSIVGDTQRNLIVDTLHTSIQSFSEYKKLEEVTALIDQLSELEDWLSNRRFPV